MKKRSLAFLVIVLAIAGKSVAQSRQTIEAYILKYREIAIEEMQRTGVPAAITLAQGIHETGAGTSDLVIKSNNHFGIKCKTEWEGEKVYHDDDARGECFRKYNDPSISYRDHSDFLKNRPYYASLFQLDPTDYEAWSYGLKKAGYATNPKYPQILIKLIRDYNLQDYTLIAMGKKSRDDNSPEWAKNTEVITPTTDAITAVPQKIYPEGVFKINETKVMAVAKGTSYLKLAEEADIALSRLLDFNDLKNIDEAAKDGLVFLQRKRKTGATPIHIVTVGESLYDIAQAEGIRLESLLDYNFLTQGIQVETGEKLYLTASAPAMPKLATEKPMVVKAVYTQPVAASVDMEGQKETYFTHTVQPKETVYSIAKKYEVEIADVVKWNDLPSNDLKIGATGSDKTNTLMSNITLHDKTFDTYLSAETIQKKIKEIAAQLNEDYKDKRPLFIAILNGSFMFAADLFKELTIEAEICFIKLASYRGMKSTGNVITSIGLDQDLFGREVIILEDIVDTGKTLHEFLPQLRHQQPASFKIVTLLHKSEATKFPLTVDYVGFNIPDKFVVGYGLDYDGLGRNLKEIYQLSTSA